MAQSAKQNHHPTREKRLWKWQKASASIVVENRDFSIFNISLRFLFSCFRLLFLAFRVKWKFHNFIVVLMHQMLDGVQM